MAQNKRYPRAKNPKMADPKSRRMEKDANEEKTFKGKVRYNDPSWYVRNGQLAKDVASLSFNNALGSKVQLGGDNAGGDWVGNVDQDYGVPGVMTLNYVPAIGISRSKASPINIAAKNLYSYVRHANSGSKNYDSPDLMMYVMAMDSIYAAIQHLQRAYGASRVYSQLNRYVGDVFLRAMGFDPNDVRANLAQFRAMINMLIVKASVFCVPNTMTLFQRHAWMNRCVFQDEPIDKCQIYLYRPLGFYKYREMTGTAGYLEFNPCCSQVFHSLSSDHELFIPTKTGWTVTQWYAYVDDLLAVLTSSEDIGIMSGDILKAYGKENCFQLGTVPEDYVLEVAYSEEILDQIHNTIMAGSLPRRTLDLSDHDQCTKVDFSTFDINQDPSIGDGTLLFGPQFANCKQAALKHILDMVDKEPTPERVLVATRNMFSGDCSIASGYANTTITTLVTCGSDIVLQATMWDYYTDATSGYWTLRGRDFFNADANLLAEIADVGDYSCFNRAPIGYYFENTTATSGFVNTLGEIDNFTVVDRNTLSKIHESAVLSMLGVPV